MNQAEPAAPAPHYCHANDCKTEVPRALLMCLKHWRMVPKEIQREVWRTYQKGQEQGKAPVTREYLAAARRAIEFVFAKEQEREKKKKAAEDRRAEKERRRRERERIKSSQTDLL